MTLVSGVEPSSAAAEAMHVSAEAALRAAMSRDESDAREFGTDADSEKPHICLLALSAIVDDPRVRRQGDLFAGNGWSVTAIGLPGGRSPLPQWRILDASTFERGSIARENACAISATPSATSHRVLAPTKTAHARFVDSRKRAFARLARWPRVQRIVLAIWRGVRLCALLPVRRWLVLKHRARMIWVRFDAELAQRVFWSELPPVSQHLRNMYEAAGETKADIWLANDWSVLPLAARLARERGGRYIYDTHELATEEYAEKWKWRLFDKPLVCAIERKFISDAAVVSAVSPGIAERLDRMYRLPRPSLVIRNTPLYQSCSFRPTGERVRVLYHGIIAPGRGLEEAIDSVATWRPEFELTIRGPENPGYNDALRQRIRDAGVEGRAQLVPPVPMTELVREANDFDIGLFALPGHSRHNEFALPNKFFEYAMAGLALCVSDLPEMARLVKQYRLGVLMPKLAPAAIAQAINGLDRERIDFYKQNALAAARELCWERESERMVTACEALGTARAAT
jgi:glycosyltransferase involved in cell wall biosynthesis